MSGRPPAAPRSAASARWSACTRRRLRWSTCCSGRTPTVRPVAPRRGSAPIPAPHAPLHARARAVGSTERVSQDMWVWNEETSKMEERAISFVRFAGRAPPAPLLSPPQRLWYAGPWSVQDLRRDSGKRGGQQAARRKHGHAARRHRRRERHRVGVEQRWVPPLRGTPDAC